MRKRSLIMLLVVLVITSGVIIILIPEENTELIIDYKLEVVFPNLVFEDLTDLQPKPDSSELMVAEQSGKLHIFDSGSSRIYLDITDRVASGGEMGLLGFAFSPSFNSTGHVFVDYTKNDPRRTVVSRFTETEGKLDSNSELIILEVEQPYSNHNAGQIMFGDDAYLYITLGDGGLFGDPDGNGQNRKTLLGSILRLDVSGDKYTIPADNPFVGNTQGWREEIYAYGLRNPWRMSQDDNGTIWVGDVGQDDYEEVDIVVKGGNYGWNVKEGDSCYDVDDCDDPKYSELIDPVHVYSHEEGVSITGGYVYYGGEFEDLRNMYIFGDYGSGKIWSLDPSNHTVKLIIDSTIQITSFGYSDDILYILSKGDGLIYRLAAV